MDEDFTIAEDWTEKTMQVSEMFRDEWYGIISNELADKYNISSNI